ncbi:peptidoglycan recognition protein-like [Microplitis mediator]|uniref:peptidoglycan recognition protein-like n=1 Tax=Microplitis mediator TaxID=375433 RepID=UPI00255572B0|nr:peptidoglycan recognition protein-like [Microplitis mediator]
MIKPSHTMQYRMARNGEVIIKKPLTLIYRHEWNAFNLKKMPEVIDIIPAPYVMIYQSGTETCFTRDTCDQIVRDLQAMKLFINDDGEQDIMYNFLISGNGNVYIGRGWNAVGNHTFGVNRKSVGIALIGTFNDQKPSEQQIFALKDLIQLGVQTDKIRENFEFYNYPRMNLHFKHAKELFSISQIVDKNEK